MAFDITREVQNIILSERPFPVLHHVITARVREAAKAAFDVAAHDKNLFRKVDYALRKLQKAGLITPAPKQQGWMTTIKGLPAPAGGN